ncbi:MAG: aminotransferase class I/II-fold pyridoxal phosphate-dependent enzyme, partial [Proteobacteria bacterium]
MLSKRAQNLKTSPTLFLVAKAKELQAQGHPVISLTVGEPDWATFPVAAKAGHEAIDTGLTKYTPANGTLELRQAIAAKIKSEIGQEYGPKSVTVASGAKFIIFGALQMLVSPGDEVILNSPYWVSYPTMIELADGVPVIVDCGADVNFKMTPEKLEKAITPKTKAFLFCSPSNPTGVVYSLAELKALAEVLKRHPHVYVISDDMYNRLMLDGSKLAPHILQAAPELKERVVLVNGGSKAYSMTGWRIGWAAGPEKVITAMSDYQS